MSKIRDKALVFICFSLMLYINQSQAQVVITNYGDPISDDSVKVLFDLAYENRSSYEHKTAQTHRTDVFLHDTAVYFLHQGVMAVWCRYADSTRLISTSMFRGYNYKCKRFFFNGHLYSLGGYGFWRKHADLIQFLPHRGEWEIIPSTKSFSGVLDNQILVRDSEILVMNPVDYFQGSEVNTTHLGIYRYDFSKNNWDLLSNNIHLEKFKDNRLYETKHYGIFIGSPTGILNKRDLSINYVDYGLFIAVANVYIHEDRFIVFDKHLEVVSDVNIDSLVRNSTSIFITKRPSDVNYRIAYFAVPAVLLVLFLLYAFNKKGNQPSLNDPLMQKILLHEQSVLSREELDVLFGLEHIISAETLRFQRSKTINRLNAIYTTHKNQKLIVRENDPQDNRRKLYRINR